MASTARTPLPLSRTTLWTNYSPYSGCSSDAGDIYSDPEFVNPEEGNYRLKNTSPCIDAGVNVENLPEVDKDGNPRVVDGDKDGTAVVDRVHMNFKAFPQVLSKSIAKMRMSLLAAIQPYKEQ
jgi:hypothetical protein